MKKFYPALLLMISLSAQAQEQTPLIGSQASEPQASLVAPQTNDGVMRILVIGDSMAGGMGNGIARMAVGDETIKVVNRFNESSAITRPDVYDWASAIPKIMDGKDFDAVVVLIGLNDRQDIRGVTGRLKFNTPEWVAAYQNNVDSIMSALAAQNVKVFWLGEPPMGDAAYDADMKLVTSLQKARVEAKGAVFFDTRAALAGPDGGYLEYGPDDTGEVKKLRQRDGVTFLKQGNNKFGQVVLAAIKAGGAAPALPTPITPAPMAQVSGPVFGQQDAKGDDVLVPSNTLVAAAGGVMPSAPVVIVEKLFVTGEMGIAPAGRFDDFSVPAN